MTLDPDFEFVHISRQVYYSYGEGICRRHIVVVISSAEFINRIILATYCHKRSTYPPLLIAHQHASGMHPIPPSGTASPPPRDQEQHKFHGQQ